MSEDETESGRHGAGETDPEGAPSASGRSLGQRALDLFLYAPAGLVMNAVEEFPELAEKGRSNIELQLSNARVVGQFAVAIGRRRLERRLDNLTRRGDPVGSPASWPADAGAASLEPERSVTRNGSVPGEEAAPDPLPTEVARATAVPVSTPGPTLGRYDVVPVDSAIPGYDSLSASQVVRRLDGLGPAELEAVYHHEAASRGRRTILHRAQQLLGIEETPGTPSPG